jgi:hypothetical protein
MGLMNIGVMSEESRETELSRATKAGACRAINANGDDEAETTANSNSSCMARKRWFKDKIKQWRDGTRKQGNKQARRGEIRPPWA